MKTRIFLAVLCALAAPCATARADIAPAPASSKGNPLLEQLQQQKIARGRYVISIGSCNECHTDGDYAKMDEHDRLTGSVIGEVGPWGTTFPKNLRLTVTTMTEEAFVKMAKTRTSQPPMPWYSLNHMSEDDLAAIYQYLKWLGPKGKPAPAPLGPGEHPAGSYYLDFPISGPFTPEMAKALHP